METIDTTIENLLAYRASYDRELFMTSVPGSASKVRLLIEASRNIIMTATTSNKNPALQSIRKFINKHINK